MSTIYETIQYKGKEIEIKYDDNASNPRTEFDNACTMVCWHSRYDLGGSERYRDIHGKHRYRPLSASYSEPIELLYELAGMNMNDYLGEHDYEDMAKADLFKLIEERGTIISPLYLYDHSGITISMGGFSCPWDSGQVGYIYITKETMDKEGWDAEHAKRYMEGEVETYDQYLTGEVYGWDTGTESCWGYYGNEGIKDAIQEAKSSIDCEIKSSIKQHLLQVKNWIKNQVPLIHRKPLQLA